ncbi:MAG: hypothetical protein F6K56_45420 [Moorea sp. SIO3G5]|nr:hypothetical protein [Moorena sp. SIO3G5]
MPTLDITVEQVIMLVKQLPLEGKKAVFKVLHNELEVQENPWLKLAGKYQDDPQFDEMLAYIEAVRVAWPKGQRQELNDQEEAK